MKTRLICILLLLIVTPTCFASPAEVKLKNVGLKCIREVFRKSPNVKDAEVFSKAESMYNNLVANDYMVLSDREKLMIRSGRFTMVDYHRTKMKYRKIKKMGDIEHSLFADYAMKPNLTELDKFFMTRLLSRLIDEVTGNTVEAGREEEAVAAAERAYAKYVRYMRKYGVEPNSSTAMMLDDTSKFKRPKDGKFVNWILLPKIKRFSIPLGRALFIAPEPIGNRRVVVLTDGNVISMPEANLPVEHRKK